MSKQIHLVCNAHIDPVWLWEWQEGVAAALSTFRTAAELCEEFDGFIFNHNEAILYQWVEEYEPALFKRIQRLVKAGRWSIMGGWFLQPDCNMPSGESFVRQILAGKGYFREKFGVDVTTAINFDPFGHSRGLVQILAKSGYDSYLICRPGQHECPLPQDEFVWVGFDGSEIMTNRASCYYNSALGQATGKIRDWAAKGGDLQIILWGVGNHGGGPSRKDLRDIAAFIESSDENVTHSTAEAYFADLAARKESLPRVDRDLNPFSVGCYTSQVRIKQKHRMLENELYATEKMAAGAAAQALMAYPAEELAEAMKDLLACEFHDVLPGSSIQAVEEASLRRLDHGLEKLSRAKARAFFALAAGQAKAKEGQIPILVHNPHPYAIDSTVECEFQLADQNWKDTFTNIRVFAGPRELPAQVEKEASNLTLDWRKNVVFGARLAPGMNRFDCRTEVIAAKPAVQLKPADGTIRIETGELTVVINSQTGLMDQCRFNDFELVAPGAFAPVVIEDNEDAWGMTVRSFRKVVGRFELLDSAAAARVAGVRAATLSPVRVVEDGAARVVVEAILDFGSSAAIIRYKVPKAGAEVEVEVRVHWNEKDRMLKLSIPTCDPQARYVGQTAYGVQALATNGDEAVAQKWVAVVSDTDQAALTLVNDGLYGSDFAGGELRMTLLRSPAYSGHPIGQRPIVPQDRYTPRIDQGERLFRFWLSGGLAAERLARVGREAAAHNEKPMALSFFPSGSGKRPKPAAVLSDEVIELAALKKAQSGGDYIVRLFNPTDSRRGTTLSLPALGVKKKVWLDACEIKTFRVKKAKGLIETDLLERPLS